MLYQYIHELEMEGSVSRLLTDVHVFNPDMVTEIDKMIANIIIT